VTDVGLLYSGGRDSTLAARLLDPFFEVVLLCGTFGITDDYEHARRAGEALGFRTERLELDGGVATEATEQMIEDGFPRNGIQRVHEHALECAAEQTFDAVADGTRRDDRAPTVDRSLARSVEDRHGVDHLAPLAGVGYGAVDAMAAVSLTVETGASERIESGDYEAELRALIAAEYGEDAVAAVFPEHVQSRVTGAGGTNETER
jgi:predicted subunit of tRNA(5-methylaminomethyl-2-thiouridylate) methyltransferase